MNIWEELLDATTEPTQPPMDEYDKPEELVEISINRIKATLDTLKKIGDKSQRFHLSTFGQVYNVMSGWKDKHYRRSFIDVQDKGQSRAFFAKFLGENAMMFRSVTKGMSKRLSMIKFVANNGKG